MENKKNRNEEDEGASYDHFDDDDGSDDQFEEERVQRVKGCRVWCNLFPRRWIPFLWNEDEKMESEMRCNFVRFQTLSFTSIHKKCVLDVTSLANLSLSSFHLISLLSKCFNKR